MDCSRCGAADERKIIGASALPSCQPANLPAHDGHASLSAANVSAVPPRSPEMATTCSASNCKVKLAVRRPMRRRVGRLAAREDGAGSAADPCFAASPCRASPRATSLTHRRSALARQNALLFFFSHVVSRAPSLHLSLVSLSSRFCLARGALAAQARPLATRRSSAPRASWMRRARLSARRWQRRSTPPRTCFTALELWVCGGEPVESRERGR